MLHQLGPSRLRRCNLFTPLTRPISRPRPLHPKLHYEQDLGVPIDVIDPHNYLLPAETPPLPPEDEAILNWKEETAPANAKTGTACVS